MISPSRFIKNGIYGKIKKLIVTVCVLVALIALTLLNSFAKDSINPITSPMAEPVPSLSVDGTVTHVKLYYVIQWNAAYKPANTYTLYELECDVPTGASLAFRITRQFTALYSTDGISPYTVRQYDILTGNLLGSFSLNTSAQSWNGYTVMYGFANSYFPENNANSDICAGGYPIVPDGINVLFYPNPTVYNSSPFVTWSIKPPEHYIYHSQLSEPESDRYNSYFILNDQLIWLSYRFNGLYSYSNDIEIESEVYNGSGSYSGTGSGSYAGSQNGYTENVSVPDGQVIGVNNATGVSELFAGSYQGFVTGNIDFTGVSQGVLSTNSNGNVTYNNKVVYPVSVSGLDYHTMFDVVARLDGKRSITFSVQPNTSQLQGLIGDMDFYESRFSLIDGSYQYSNYRHYTGQNGFFTYTIQPQKQDIEDVRSYGMLFVNPNNIPVNLSDVIWEYDLEFVNWRDSMLSFLTNIYNVLSQGQDVPEPESYQDWQSELAGAEQTYSNVTPADIKLQLNNALSDGNYGSVAAVIKSWVNAFSIPQLITLCVVALALGTVTLTLGKKKSE